MDTLEDYQIPYNSSVSYNKKLIGNVSMGDDPSSTVFITTRPSELEKSPSLLAGDSRNVRAYMENSGLSGSEIIGSSSRGLKNFLSTYFTGNRKGENILDKFTKKKSNPNQSESFRVRSQGVKNRRLRHHPSGIYS